ncbi:MULTISPECIES: hypothetical protein [unclassified Streptomyces]|uniref:hypothetical protein n=1 Tax=unclassified Streptomyces TaxID=2593676 RepID=UPI00278BDF7A|nr:MULTISPECIES: hypothetical protein [unclassified Streptomyces]
MKEKRPHIPNPPALTAVHRAVVTAMGDHGPLRVPRTEVARLAGTDRQFLLRNWPDRHKLHLAAVKGELQRLLRVAAELADFSDMPPSACLAVRQIVRAARLVREHPVTAATARTEPGLLHAALLQAPGPLHNIALSWITGGPLVQQARETRDFGALAQLMFAVALPFALTPGSGEREAHNARLARLLHTCTTGTAVCSHCNLT